MVAATFLSPRSADAQGPRPSDDPLRHGHALLIGNSHYRAWPELVDVPLQLNELEKGLKNHFDTVEVVKDLEIDPLRQKIDRFLRSYGNDSNARLFIYYAGHGYTELSLLFSEYRGYITGIDTPAVDGTQRAWDAARLKAMSMTAIRSTLAEVPAKHILVVFDSCFAGTIFTSRAGNDPPRMLTPDVVARLMEKQARDIITAGGANELVPAHSPIPRLLLAALNGEADVYRHGVISAAEIHAYLRANLLPRQDMKLTPQVGKLPDPGFTEGAFLFRVPQDTRPAQTSPPSNAPTFTVPPAAATPGEPASRIDPAGAPVVTWKLQNTFPAATPTTLPFFIRRVGELSSGRMKVELLAANTVVPRAQLLDAVSQGTFDLGYGMGNYFYGKDRAFALMTAVPFGFEPRDHLAFRRRPDVVAVFDRLLAKQGVVALPCGSFGRNGEFWLKKPLTATVGLKGAKLRFLALSAEIYREAGITLYILSDTEVVPALERGLLDGAQFANPKSDIDVGLPDVAKYYYHPASVVPGYVLDLFIAKTKWDELPPIGRQIVEQACQEAADAMVNDYERLNKEALADMTRRGVTVVPLSVAVQRDLYAASRKVLANITGENDAARTVMAIVEQMRSSTLAAKMR